MDIITPSIAELLGRLLVLPPEIVARGVGYKGSTAAELAGAVFDVLTALDAKSDDVFQLQDLSQEAQPLQEFAKNCPEWQRLVCRPATPASTTPIDGPILLKETTHDPFEELPAQTEGVDGNAKSAEPPAELPAEPKPRKRRTKKNAPAEPQPNSEANPEPKEGQAEQSQSEQPTPAQPQPEQPKPQPKAEPPKPEDKTLIAMLGMVKAGLRNLWLHGPAGCGKTTQAHALAEQWGVPCYVLSCSKDTDPCQIQGRRYPEPEESTFTKYYESPAVLVLDEFTAVEADTAMLLNAALANGQFETSTKRVARRHPDCVIIATSNTLGLGGDAIYNGNQRLDASTRDRFACGFIEVDYSKEYESRFDKDVVAYANTLREIIKRCDLQQICSTRSIINADALKKVGLEWKPAMVSTWTKEEKSLLPKEPEHPAKKATQEGLGL